VDKVHISGNLSREKLRDIRSLESSKVRRRKGLCVVEGERTLNEALRTGNLVYLVISGDAAAGGGSASVMMQRPDLPCYILAPSLFREISVLRSGTGLMGVARIPDQPARDRLDHVPGRTFLLLLDGVQEPGNVGALIRTAWALGAPGVLLGEGTADPYGARAVRDSAGSVFHLPLYAGIGHGKIRDLKEQGYTLFVALKGGQDYRTIAYPERCILALGNEGAGFSPWVLQSGSPVGIPLAEGVDSLNVVVAGGIIASKMVE